MSAMESHIITYKSLKHQNMQNMASQADACSTYMYYEKFANSIMYANDFGTPKLYGPLSKFLLYIVTWLSTLIKQLK